MIAQPSIDNHCPCCGQSANGLLHGDRLRESEQSTSFLQCRNGLRVAHDHQRHRTSTFVRSLQVAQKLRASVQITVDDESVNLRLAEPLQRALWFMFDSDINLKTT